MVLALAVTSRTAATTPPTRYLTAGIIASLVIHIGLWLVLSRPEPLRVSRTITVEFIPAPPDSLRTPEPTIVTPPEPRPAPALASAFRSDTDNVVVREQIKRGDAPDAGAIGAAGPRGPVTASAATNGTRANTRPPSSSPSEPRPAALKHLSLDPATVINTFSATPAPTRELARTIMGDVSTGATPRPFSRPSGSGAAIVGLRGSSDYLPNLPDGDLTLLNTKANRFAVFVRRVATQVFGQLRRSGWENLSPGDIDRIRDFTTVNATLTPQGELLGVTIAASSGSPRFDEVVLDAVRAGARDPHPPPGAEASDGNIHFIFRSKSWVRLSTDPRAPGFGERRWILLGTGLD